MSIDSTTLSQARERGYTDEEIYSKLIQNEPSFSEVQKRGYTLDEIAKTTDSKITQGGEQNEVQKPSQPEANSDSNEQRQANEQVQPSVKQGVQPSKVQLPEPQGEEERVGNINTNLNANEGSKEIPQGTEGQKEGEGVRVQSPAGNEAQVAEEEAKVPPLDSVRGMILSPFAYIGEAGWKGIAGLANTVGADSVAAYATEQSIGSIQNLKVLGAAVPEKGAARTVGEIGALAIEAPIMLFGGLLGVGAFLAQGYGGMKEDLRARYIKEGMSEDDANNKSTGHAALATAAAIPAYILGGRIGGKVADSLIAESAPKMLELTARFGIGGAANMVASSVSRGFAAGLEGEDIVKAMKETSLTGVLQDFAFAGHANGEWFKNSIKKEEAAKLLPDNLLKDSLVSSDRAVRVAAQNELKVRAAGQEKAAAEATDLPETAKVVGVVEPTSGLKKMTDIVAEQKAAEEQKPAGVTGAAKTITPEVKITEVKQYPKDPTEEVESIYKTAEEALKAGDRDTAVASLNAAKEAEVRPENAVSPEMQKARNERWNELDSSIEKIADERLGAETKAKEEVNLSGSIEGVEILGLNAKKAFGYLAKNKNTPEPLRELVKAISNFAGSKKLGADIIRRMPEKGEEGFTPEMEGALGARKKDTKSILIPRGKVDVGTVIHEGLHTLTQDEIDTHVAHIEGETGYKYLERLNESLAKDTTPEPVKRLINLYKLALLRSKDGEQTAFDTYFHPETGKAGMAGDAHALYGFKDLHEFVSEAFTNKEFQDVLKSMKGDEGKSVWQNFLDTLSELFKVPKGSMLESVMDSSLGIIKLERKATTGVEVQERFAKTKEMFPETAALAKEVSTVFSNKKDPMAWQKTKDKFGMFRDDLKAMGIKGASSNIKEEGKGLVSGLVEAGSMIGDLLDGKTIPKLTRAGVKLAAVLHANAMRSIDPQVKSIISQVFPEKYQMSAEGIKVISESEWNIEKLQREKMRLEKYGKDKYSPEEYANRLAETDSLLAKSRKILLVAKKKYDRVGETMDIINKDNILAGADTITDEIGKRSEELKTLQLAVEAGTAGRGSAAKIQGVKEHIADLNEALEAINEKHNLEQYAKDVEAAKGTDIEEDITRWKEIVNPIMDQLYKKVHSTQDIPPTERGRVFGARVNLLAEWEAAKFMEGDNMDGPVKPQMNVDYRNPDIKQDRLDQKAAFSAEYSNDAEAILKNSLAARTNEATKIDFYNKLVEKGVAVMSDANQKIEEIQGKPVARMEFELPVRQKDGKGTRLVNQSMWVRADLMPEIKQILNMTEKGEQHPIAKAVTQLQLVGIADMVAHLKNLHGSVTLALGRDSNASDVANMIPFVGQVNAVREIMSVMKEIQSDSPKIRAEKAELARLSGMRPHYDQTGIMKLLTKHQHDLLHETDIAARIIMSRRYKSLVERFDAVDTPEAKIDFVNQIGEYNRRLMGRHEAALRDSGWSPFIVAGRAMNRLARRRVLAQTGFDSNTQKAQLGARAVQASALVMATVVPAMVNLMTTGSMFGRNGTPIGAIDFGENFDTEEGRMRIFDLFQAVGIRRGLRQIGFNALVEGWRNGLSSTEIQKNVANDMISTSLHPFLGPAAGLVVSTITGKRLDMRVGFSDIYTSRKVGGFAQYLEQFRTGLKQQNELLYSSGLGYAIEKGMEVGLKIPRPMEQGTSETMRQLGIPEAPVVKQLFTAGATALGAYGFKLNSTPAQKLSSQLGSKQQYTPQQDIRYNYRKAIIEAVKKNDNVVAKQLLDKGIEEGVLTKADMKTMKGQIKQPDILIRRVSMLKTAEDAVSVFRVADAEEQDKIVNIVYKKIKGASAMTEADRVKLVNELKSVAKPNTKLHKLINQ